VPRPALLPLHLLFLAQHLRLPAKTVNRSRPPPIVRMTTPGSRTLAYPCATFGTLPEPQASLCPIATPGPRCACHTMCSVSAGTIVTVQKTIRSILCQRPQGSRNGVACATVKVAPCEGLAGRGDMHPCCGLTIHPPTSHPSEAGTIRKSAVQLDFLSCKSEFLA
jgi:hypothetical protein